MRRCKKGIESRLSLKCEPSSIYTLSAFQRHSLETFSKNFTTTILLNITIDTSTRMLASYISSWNTAEAETFQWSFSKRKNITALYRRTRFGTILCKSFLRYNTVIIQTGMDGMGVADQVLQEASSLKAENEETKFCIEI